MGDARGQHAMAQAVHGTAPGDRGKGNRQCLGIDPEDQDRGLLQTARLLDHGGGGAITNGADIQDPRRRCLDRPSGLAGGGGIAPSLNAGGEHAMAQAVHGTAPDIAGRGIANPSALMLSTASLLNWFYQKTGIAACRETARRLDFGVRNAIASGAATPDLGGDASTDAFATAVIAALEAA